MLVLLLVLGTVRKHDFSLLEVRSGDQAREIFCKCHFKEGHAADKNGDELTKLCPGITSQCRRSFCKPLCLRMAWKPVINVDCSKAPTWQWCPKFKAQVKAAEKALVAQFRAFTCMNLHFCNETRSMYEWIENHSFGNQYPQPHLPIEVCEKNSRHASHRLQNPQSTAKDPEFLEVAERQADLLCTACSTVISVDIERGECLPQFKHLQPGSLQERCLYLADVIGQHKEALVRQLKSYVCPCLGCCGLGKCIFRNPEEGWLDNLVNAVQQRVSSQLEVEGWVGMNKGEPSAAEQRVKKREHLHQREREYAATHKAHHKEHL